MTVNNGILTIDSPNGGDTYSMPVDWSSAYWDTPPDPLSRNVDNHRGWWIEARFRVDPRTPQTCHTIEDQGGVGFRGGDFDREFRLFVGPTSICILTLNYPDTQMVSVALDSTSAYRVYRLVVKDNTAKVYVDGSLVIDYAVPLDLHYGSDPGIWFGNFYEIEPMRSYWDYLTFDVRGLAP